MATAPGSLRGGENGAKGGRSPAISDEVKLEAPASPSVHDGSDDEVDHAKDALEAAADGRAAELLEEIEQFFCGPEFTTAIGEFLGEGGAGSHVVLVAVEDEQPLANHDAFSRYAALVESQLAELAERLGATHEQLVEACAVMQESDGGASMCIDYILASVDYETFLGVVYDFRQLLGYTYVPGPLGGDGEAGAYALAARGGGDAEELEAAGGAGSPSSPLSERSAGSSKEAEAAGGGAGAGADSPAASPEQKHGEGRRAVAASKDEDAAEGGEVGMADSAAKGAPAEKEAS